MNPFLGSGHQGMKCPSAGTYSPLKDFDVGDSETTFVYVCDFHGINDKVFGSAN